MRDATNVLVRPGQRPSLRLARAALACAALAAAGCTTLGPKSIPVDRSDYSAAIAESWKQQTLLNIVKLRYMDLPVFVDVASIVAGYSMQTGVSVSGTSSSPGAIQGDFVAGSGQAIYTDRPTITYVPLTGERFLRGLITPIDPRNIFFMLQAGYAADFILGLTVESLNGVRNRSTAGGEVREADPEFVRAIQLMREVQVAGAVGMRVVVDPAVAGETAVVFFRRDDVPPEIREKSAEIRRLLRLPEEPSTFKLIYSPARGEGNELAVNSRSMLQIMGAFASYVDVPMKHLEEHRATPSFEDDPDGGHRPVRIRSSQEQPPDAFASVHYRDHWFWVDDGDFQTKRALNAVMFFFTLAETGSSDKLPVVTIPAQ